MIAIAKASDTEREVLFGNAADRVGISNPAIVEKDFWVCFALDYPELPGTVSGRTWSQ
jgi:hypothetical protein